MASNDYLCQPIAVLFNYHSWGFFERKWIGYPLARDVSLSYLRWSDDPLKFPEVPEETGVKGSRGQAVKGSSKNFK
jgi:hypothetical protein